MNRWMVIAAASVLFCGLGQAQTPPPSEISGTMFTANRDAAALPGPAWGQWRSATYTSLEFRSGKCYASAELNVDGGEVMRRSCDFEQVWYAPGWDAAKTAKVIDQVLYITMGTAAWPPKASAKRNQGGDK